MLCVGLTSVVLREVLDKVPSVPTLLSQAAVLACAAYVLGRLWPLTLFVPFLVAAVLIWGIVDMYSDPALGSAVWHEGGAPYLAAQLAAPVAAIVAGGVALWSRRRRT